MHPRNVHPSASIAELLERRLERVLAAWEAEINAGRSAARPPAQRAGAPAEALVHALIGILRGRPAAGAAVPARDARDAARAHAAERLREGASLDDLLDEYRALRAAALAQCMEAAREDAAPGLEDVARLDGALDRLLAGAVTAFHSRLERSRNVFVGVLGHDLRNPLGAIVAAADLQLLTDDLGMQRQAAERIRNSSERMRRMIEDLLDFTRTRLGEPLSLSPVPADLGDICARVAEELRAMYPAQTIRFDRDGTLAGVWDVQRIERMLSNLIRNAVEHGDGAVTVRGNGRSDAAVLSVHNSGPPIPADVQRTVFNPLRRGDAESEHYAERSRGLGLGLYIVKEIAEAHGGGVELTSSAEAGTTFTVHLPKQRS